MSEGERSLDAEVDAAAKVVWDYLNTRDTLRRADAILVLCSYDTRVADYAAQLFLEGLADWLIFSGGGKGRITENLFSKPEADFFADIAEQEGVPRDRILIENKSGNTGENIRFTHDLLGRKKLDVASLILVQKPYMLRRTYATFKKQWPGASVDIMTTAPSIAYEDYAKGEQERVLMLNVMVGDMQRIKVYAEQGLQIPQDIPDNVWRAYEKLVKLGYDKRLI